MWTVAVLLVVLLLVWSSVSCVLVSVEVLLVVFLLVWGSVSCVLVSGGFC